MSNFNTRKDRLPNGKARPHNLKRWERYPGRSSAANGSASVYQQRAVHMQRL